MGEPPAPRVDIAADVLPAWREMTATGLSSSFTFRLAPVTPIEDALEALATVVVGVIDNWHVEHSSGPGEWHWVRAASDVLVTARGSAVFDELLPAIAAGLAERGVAGEISVHAEDAAPPRWPDRLIETRMRVRGRRRHIAERTYAWEPQPTSVERVLDVAVEWCARGTRSVIWLLVSDNPPVRVDGNEIRARVHEAVRSAAIVEVRTRARGVAIDVSTGRISAIGTEPWGSVGASLVGVLRAAAADLAYGLIKTGSSPAYVLMGESIRFDWPPRPDVDPDRVRRGAAFEDEYAPDAFAFQLLGPCYANRVPVTPLYRATAIGAATLLEHVDSPSWFEAPFVPRGLHFTEIRGVAPPRVLVEARAALAPILFRPAA